MLDELRDRIIAYSSQHRICILSTRGTIGAWVAPARFYNVGLEWICQLPRWSDVLYHLEQSPQVMLVIPDVESDELRWLQISGNAQVISPEDSKGIWPQAAPGMGFDESYVTIHISPVRIDFIDENRGWGARETLDF